MNRKLLALAVGAVVALPLAAQAAPTLYGKVNVSGDYLSGDSFKDNWELNSNSSRFGLKGEENLGDNMSALYQVEMGVEMTNGDGSLSSRNRFVGIKNSNLGTLRLGRFDSPFKAAEGTVDVFNDQRYTDMEVAVGLTGQGRLSRVVDYTSPLLADAVTIDFAIQQGANMPSPDKIDHQSDGYAASAVYNNSGLYLALGLEKNLDDQTTSTTSTPSVFTPATGSSGIDPTANTTRDGLRLVATYTTGDLQVGGLLQSTSVSHKDIAGGKSDEQGGLLSAAYNMNKCTLKGELGYNKFDFGSGNETKVSFAGLGYDHHFSKMTKGYATVGYQKVEPTGVSSVTNTDVSVGLETLF
jgi:predicted porin